MADQDNLTAKQNDYAIFLPAISGFYATYIGKQRVMNYVDPARMPAGIKDMEQLNWLNPQKSLFPYRWSLYSAGHANLDLLKEDPTEDMVRKRDPDSFILGDSGGFQIAKGVWEGEWRDPTSEEVKQELASRKGRTRTEKNKRGKLVVIDEYVEFNKKLAAAQKQREAVLKWLDGISDYAMTLDIPTWIAEPQNVKEQLATGIKSYTDAVQASKYNYEFFMKHRKGVKNGGAKFLNVLQGANHTAADHWYETMKEYCDPVKYPDTHFDGWSFGGQNMCDMHLILRRLVALQYDNLLQQGKHDWLHVLGTSRLEWAVLFTDIQRAIRKYINPNFTISFDCASPFLATANGQLYHEIVLEHDSKWSYRMSPGIDDKKYSTDTRSLRDVALQDHLDHFVKFDESAVSKHLQVKDICVYGPGDLNKIGKEGRTSWDSFSYALQMAHNVWIHTESVQAANRKYDEGQEWPAMAWNSNGDHIKFRDIVEAIFLAPDRETAEAVIEKYDTYWTKIKGGRGFIGEKARNSHTKFAELFDFEGNTVDETTLDETKLELLEQGEMA